MSEEKHGIVCAIPLTCGTCGHVGKSVYLRWCGACGEAICPTCFPASEAATYPHRCAKCLAAMKALVQVPKTELDKALRDEAKAKKRRKQRKHKR